MIEGRRVMYVLTFLYNASAVKFIAFASAAGGLRSPTPSPSPKGRVAATPLLLLLSKNKLRIF